MLNVRLPVFFFTLLVTLGADVRNCACDVAKPETLEARECGLCKVAELQPADVFLFLLKDNNPRKPNRWLALPRAHYPGDHPLREMPLEQRTRLWTAAIGKANELWGDSWGLAINGDEQRTQCHAHIHIGKLLDNVETGNFAIVTSAAEIPLPANNTGLWVHPVLGKLHVHTGEQITESNLLR